MSAPIVAGRSGATPQIIEQRRARRAEMRQFYGLKAGDAPKPTEYSDQAIIPSHTVSELGTSRRGSTISF